MINGRIPKCRGNQQSEERTGWKDVPEGGKGINRTFLRLRLIVLTALTTGMRIAEIFGLKWCDLLYEEELIAVRAKLTGGKVRYVPMPLELAAEFRRFPAIFG